MSRKKMTRLQPGEAIMLFTLYGRHCHRSRAEKLVNLADIGGAKHISTVEDWLRDDYMPATVESFLRSFAYDDQSNANQIEMDFEESSKTESQVQKIVEKTVETTSTKTSESYRLFFTARKKVMEDMTACLINATSEEERIAIYNCFSTMYHFEIVGEKDNEEVL